MANEILPPMVRSTGSTETASRLGRRVRHPVGARPNHRSRETRLSLSRRQARTGYAFISPWALGFLLFTAFPLVFGAYISFTSYTGLNPPKWVGFANYRHALSGADPLIVIAVKNTLEYIAISVPLTVLGALGIALLLNKPLPGIGLFRTLIYTPTVVPIVAGVSALAWLFQGQYGIINQLLTAIGLPAPGWLTDPNIVVWVFVTWTIWTSGMLMLIFLAGLQSISPSLYEAVAVDGGGPVRQFFHVTVPMLSPIIFFNVIFQLLTSSQIFLPALLLVHGTNQFSLTAGPSDSLLFYVLYIYQNAFLFANMGYAASLAWLLCLALLLTVAAIFLVGRKLVYYET